MSSNRVPGLFILGFTKCATSSLHHWLIHHPKIEGGIRKELEFLYDRDSYFYNDGKGYHDTGLAGYMDYFEGVKDDSILLDSTPAYAYHETALDVVSKMDEPPLCVFVTRDPVEHILSTYHYFSNNKLYIPKDVSLENFLEMILNDEVGDAFEQDHLKHAKDWADFPLWLDKWRAILPEDKMITLEMRTMLKSPKESVNQIVERLNLDTTPFETYEFPGANETYYIKNRSLQQVNTLVRGLLPKGKTYDYLRQLYRKLNGGAAKPKPNDRETELLNKIRHYYALPVQDS